MPQSLAQIYVHLIFSTKHREPLLPAPLRAGLYAYLAGIFTNLDSPAIEIGGVSDHVHTLFRQSKNVALAKIVAEVKSSSSKWIKTQCHALRNFHWRSGYGGFSVSTTELDAVVKYVASQEIHHRVVSFQDEFRRFMQESGIAYDERYVWD